MQEYTNVCAPADVVERRTSYHYDHEVEYPV